jgi:ABC-type proline/glycine betaine transport system permease subunit
MAHDMPAYVKRSSFAGALLLAPFFILLTVHAITGNHMYASWFWEQAVLATWIIYMPALAVLISAIAFGYWIASHRKQQGFIKSIFDLPHNWPLLAVATLGAGVVALVLFHDSVHCIVHNPITELRNWHATWQCIQRG